MKIFPSLPEEPTLEHVFRRFPHTVRPLLEYHDRLLRDHSPLTVAERELIAAYVSGLNACAFCHGAHVLAAKGFGIDPHLFEGLMADLATAAVDERMKPILAYVRKLTLTPSRMIPADADAVYAAGWDEQALFDAVSVCALFNFMNRIVEGSGIKTNPLTQSPSEIQARMNRMGRPGSDPHRSDHRYTRLLELWGIKDPAG